jgi:hypothetical protein
MPRWTSHKGHTLWWGLMRPSILDLLYHVEHPLGATCYPHVTVHHVVYSRSPQWPEGRLGTGEYSVFLRGVAPS